MDKNKKIIIGVVLVVAVIGLVYFATRKEVIAPLADDISNVENQACYFKETVGEASSDFAFTSINYDAGGKVHGIINWLPGEKDSLVGAYTGMMETNTGMVGYPIRLNVVYAGIGEGLVSNQQEIILVGANDIKTGTGERFQDIDSVWKFKDINNLTYGNVLPKVDCGVVPERISTDYSKVERDESGPIGK